jgi:hypothetical protein
MNETNELSEKFGEDAQEQLRIENEILRIKLQVELGGIIEDLGGNENIPIEVENMFLQNILDFEHQFEQAETLPILYILGNPTFKEANELNEFGLKSALNSFNKMMMEHHLQLNFNTEYSNRQKYTFITEEFLYHRIVDVKVDGLITHFSYEDFHPNHHNAIEDKAASFISHWFDRNFHEYNNELADELMLQNGLIIPKSTVIKKFDNIFAAYKSFDNCEYAITNIEFEIDDETLKGNGFAEGAIHHQATLENYEQIIVEGKFKLSMQWINGEWKINFFSWPNFQW